MKIFGIGLSKTGTTSLASALEILGYRTRDYPGLNRYTPGDLSSIDGAILEAHEALTDTPIPSFYRELDSHYPGSKFIVTVRDMEGWLLSCKKQFTPKLAEKQNEAHNQLFMELYGTTVFDEALFRQGYQRFVQGVLDHFKHRPQDLLVLNVAAGDGWEALCGFLGKPIPELPFPKANVTRIRWMDLQELVSIAKEAGQQVLRAHRSVASAGGEDGTPALIPALVRKTVYSLRGGRSFAIEAATADAQKLLSKRLAKLNAEIPLVSRQSHAAPSAERARWNHFWIVDPLDGEAVFGSPDGDFSVNLALIEDQKPIAGVVYAPLSDTVYFAMTGKGAFKSVAGGSAIRLEATAGTAATTPAMVLPPPAAAGSKALALCRLIEAGGGTEPGSDASMEWQSAAPHAMARLLGRRVCATAGATELAYNKADWRNPRLHIA